MSEQYHDVRHCGIKSFPYHFINLIMKKIKGCKQKCLQPYLFYRSSQSSNPLHHQHFPPHAPHVPQFHHHDLHPHDIASCKFSAITFTSTPAFLHTSSNEHSENFSMLKRKIKKCFSVRTSKRWHYTPRSKKIKQFVMKKLWKNFLEKKL